MSTPVKSDFTHMDELYKLLPVYRQTKDAMATDRDSPDSIAWHHTIDMHAVEVTACSFFFNRMVGEIISGTFRSYDGEHTGFKSRNAAAAHYTTEYIPLVYITDYKDMGVNQLLNEIPKMLNTFFLRDFPYIWPPAVSSSIVNLADRQADESKDDRSELDISNDSEQTEEVSETINGADWSECQPGRFAVVHFYYGEGPTYHSGIDLYRVESLNIPDIPVENEYDNTFNGKQLICTRACTKESCLYGKWHYHNVRSREVNVIVAFTVKHYFDGPLEDYRFPTNTQRFLSELHKTHVVFQDNRQLD